MNEDMYKTSYTPIIEQSSSHSCSSLNLVIPPIQQHCPLPRYGHQRDMATIWLPARYGCQCDMAASAIWLPVRYGCQRDMLACKILAINRMPISSNLTYPAALLLARYSCQRDIASDAIWLPVRYACLQDIGCLFPVKLPLRRY